VYEVLGARAVTLAPTNVTRAAALQVYGPPPVPLPPPLKRFAFPRHNKVELRQRIRTSEERFSSMDLGIKELGITFMVGAFTVLGLEAILHYFFDVQLTGFFQGKLGLGNEEEEAGDGKGGGGRKKAAVKRGDGDTKENAMKTVVFVALAFAIGILAEDLSYKYVDSIQVPIKTLPARLLPDDLINTLDLPSKYDSRVKTLINDPMGEARPQWLAYDLARSGAFSRVDPVNGPRVERWMINPEGCRPGGASTDVCPSLKEVTDSVLRLYYFSKNRVYAEETYYDEMKRIQTRLEFSRSISMIAFLYFIFALLMVAPAFMVSRRRRADDQQERIRLHVRVPAVLSILFLVFFFSLWAYERESDEFNKRAFGYFSTMLIEGAAKQGGNNAGR
jgi:hypothetical protein